MTNTCTPYTETITLNLQEAYGEYSDAIMMTGIVSTMLATVTARIIAQSKFKSSMLEQVLGVTASALFVANFVGLFLNKYLGSKLGKLEITFNYGCETHTAIRQGVKYTWVSPSLIGMDIRSI
ncbi:MAG: hypothetical protein Q8N88_05845 [Nanoarchaeota archaeon]|nr:hypothetical protein [Nanoarchaeota archaeon]